MSGVDNLRGIDYQISCSVLLALSALAGEDGDLSEVQIDSLDDTNEDLSFRFRDRPPLQIQIKKLAEGYNWTASTLRPVLSRFAQLDDGAECWFVSDGSAARQILPLKRFLAGEAELPLDVQNDVCGHGLSVENLNSLAGRVRLRTRFFPSPDEADPASAVRAEIHRSLLRGPFSTTDDPAVIAPRLWHVLYDAGLTGEAISKDHLLARFREAGLSLLRREWALYPTAERYYTHVESVEGLVKSLGQGTLILIYGIGGCGKTTIAAEAALEALNTGRATCWITVDELLEPADFIRVLSDYCVSQKLPSVAEQLRASEPATIGNVVAEDLHRYAITITLDRFEAANTRFESFIRDTLMRLPADERNGTLLITSRSRPDWWPDVEREKGVVRTIPLSSLPGDSGVQLLEDAGVCSTEEERSELVALVGNHAQSVTLLRQLRNAFRPDALASEGLEATRDWLLRQVLGELPNDLKTALARISIFDYAAPKELAFVVLGELGPDTLRTLAKRDLVRINLGVITVHDTLRDAALSLLSTRAIERCNREVADYLLGEIKKEYRTEGGVLYENSIRWATHLESSGDVSDLGGRSQYLLDAEPAVLRDLFGISTRGFPYEFDDPNLDDTFAAIAELEEEGVIEEHPANVGKDVWVEPPYRLRGFSVYDDLLLKSLCLRHGYAGHVGYTDNLRANYAFEMQALVCPWEHCIELSPFPRMTRGEYEASLEDDRRRLATEADLAEPHRQVLQKRIDEGIPDWVVEDRDEELHARSCPIFGHACPGGRTQAEVCAANDGDVFLWADKPVLDTRSDEPNADPSSV